MRYCWVCDSDKLSLIKKGNVETLNPEQFRITDANYGITHSIYRCCACHFLQCDDVKNVIQYYQSMDDPEYDATSAPRARQAISIIKHAQRMQKKFKLQGNNLLDVGAGIGLLVEKASALGFNAVGIDPSIALCKSAREKDITLYSGVLPNENLLPSFDIITMIDVIEHVIEPITLLREVHKLLNKDGIAVIVTPDVNSISAKCLGWKWWHFRVAHVGYFNKETLIQLIERAGFTLCNASRPTWYLPMDYLLKRLLSYISPRLSKKVPKLLSNITVPLNLFDSLTIVIKKK